MKQNKFFNSTLLLLALLFLCCAKIFASQPDSIKYKVIDNYIQNQMKTYKIPGVSLGIVKDGSPVYLKGYGIADDNGRSVTPQTPFLLASVTKSFTALGIMQLVEEGKIDLDAPVQQYLPWFRVSDVKASSQITVRQLLNQTSGFSTLDGVKKYADSDVREDALEKYIRSLKATQLIASPGEKFEYSNINYGILGLIIQKISGVSYENYIQKRIFNPLNMQHSYTSLADAREGGVSRGYYPFFGITTIYDKPLSRAVTPWGGIYSSAEDMTHYLIAHLNEGQYLNGTILSPKGMVELHSPGNKSNYAMGWGVFPYDKIYTAISHEGGGPYFHSYVLLVPEKKFGIVLLINMDDPTKESILSYLGWIIAEIYFGKEPSYPQASEPFFFQYSRIIYAVVVILLIAGIFWSVFHLRRWHGQSDKYNHRLKKFLIYVLIPLIVDISLAIYILTILLPQHDATIRTALVFAPDLSIMAILILTLTIVWGTVRTLLMLLAILKKPKAILLKSDN